MGILLVNKPEGLTPLQALQLFKVQHTEYSNVNMTYAGRLDPMASGLLLFLSGPEIVEKEQYLKLPKTYRARILIGLESDSDDILGLVAPAKAISLEPAVITSALQGLKGKINLPLPIFSSPPIDGEPMFVKAKKGELTKAEAVVKEMNFSRLELIGIEGLDLKDELVAIEKRIKKVTGDFRQEEVLASWQQIGREKLQLVNVEVECSSGSYIRSLASALGKRLGTEALLYSLVRAKIGEFDLSTAFNLQDPN